MSWGNKTKLKVLLRSRGRCAWCKKNLTMDTMTIDHVKPKSRGGSNAKNNLQAMCKECNKEKDNLTPWEFFQRRLQECHDGQYEGASITSSPGGGEGARPGQRESRDNEDWNREPGDHDEPREPLDRSR